MSFALHPRLAEDTIELGSLSLSRLLLMNDSRYPWCLLVPQREGIREIYELNDIERSALLEEISVLSKLMQTAFEAHKINVAALGNQVPQLHVHVIARRTTDPAWPSPVWGAGTPVSYDAAALAAVRELLVAGLGARLQTVEDSAG